MSNRTENLVMYSTGTILALCVLLILNYIFRGQEHQTGVLLFFNVTMIGSILVFSMNIISELKSRL